jgi:hypothetical protein
VHTAQRCHANNRLGSAQILKQLDHAPYTVLQRAQRVALGTLLFKCVSLGSRASPSTDRELVHSLSCVGLRERLDSALRSHQVTLILQVTPLSSRIHWVHVC